jgi:hypothetical protein
MLDTIHEIGCDNDIIAHIYKFSLSSIGWIENGCRKINSEFICAPINQ